MEKVNPREMQIVLGRMDCNTLKDALQEKKRKDCIAWETLERNSFASPSRNLSFRKHRKG
jgi:hypothetical protein